jgi:hypothetical protein
MDDFIITDSCGYSLVWDDDNTTWYFSIRHKPFVFASIEEASLAVEKYREANPKADYSCMIKKLVVVKEYKFE